MGSPPVNGIHVLYFSAQSGLEWTFREEKRNRKTTDNSIYPCFLYRCSAVAQRKLSIALSLFPSVSPYANVVMRATNIRCFTSSSSFITGCDAIVQNVSEREQSREQRPNESHKYNPIVVVVGQTAAKENALEIRATREEEEKQPDHRVNERQHTTTRTVIAVVATLNHNHHHRRSGPQP